MFHRDHCCLEEGLEEAEVDAGGYCGWQEQTMMVYRVRMVAVGMDGRG